MFLKRRDKPTVLTQLLELYNDVANQSLFNLSLEENNKQAEALQGWKSLHTSLLFKIDTLEKIINQSSLTAEENNLLEEIKILKAQSDEHLERLQKKFEIYLKSNNSNNSNINNNPSSASSRYNVPTLRSSNPQLMKKYNQSARKPMIKSLRAQQPSHSSSSSLSTTSATRNAQTAATLSWKNEDINKFSNWSPSTSLNPKNSKSYSTTNIQSSNNEINNTHNYNNHNQISQKNGSNGNDFDDFSTLDIQTLKRNEALEQLEKMATSSKNARHLFDNKSDENINHLNKNFSTLRVSKTNNTGTTKQPTRKPPPPPPSSTSSPPPLAHAPAPAPPSVPSSKLHHHTAKTSNSASNLQVKKQMQQAKDVSRSNSKEHLIKHQSPSPGRHNKKDRVKNNDKYCEDSEPDNEYLDSTDSLDSDEGNSTDDSDEKLIRSLRGVDPFAAKQILNEIVVQGDEVHWDDISGLEVAKNSLKEAVVYPFLRPDLFSGLREPARGMLLFGPPGTGKTMLARAVATESKSTFFSISASSLTSKYLGESEKLVRALFQLAKKLAPSIIFVDEIDSLLSSRNNEGENESSRRIKNEFLVQWSDLTKAAAGKDQGEDLQRVLVLAATNLPWAIDEAARRRFVRRQYIPLPEHETRKQQLQKLLGYQNHSLTPDDLHTLTELTEGFSGSDITALAKDAAMGPLRQLGDKLLLTNKNEIRPINITDFSNSLNYIRPSVSKEGLAEFEDWAKQYGSSGV
ncbi:hypothetical protein PACTADRAFT_50847 [Pachysolen tannophilus NRRL Y-2460]|uniref:AAA+ ATPase domain-containing protein n=1 Tax=Pachysolen tannophilus NRRL Y-2460 TaxID=669874 RepID=A0A1E4TTL4_PACTA|nr:hypothetical protein PACTADRAFT_50847 [Pachysolen tannophilus NRRL Y-2460]